VTSLVWAQEALDDIEMIRSFIARDSEHYAALTVERIIHGLERLRDFPGSGRVVPEIGREDLREILLGAYRVVYRLEVGSVTVLTVVHSARLFPS
jgi:plasmid stabilization system protein ParE